MTRDSFPPRGISGADATQKARRVARSWSRSDHAGTATAVSFALTVCARVVGSLPAGRGARHVAPGPLESGGAATWFEEHLAGVPPASRLGPKPGQPEHNDGCPCSSPIAQPANLWRPDTAVRTIALILAPSCVARSSWRRSGRTAPARQPASGSIASPMSVMHAARPSFARWPGLLLVVQSDRPLDMPETFTVTLDGAMLPRGFYLYVWEITPPHGGKVLYVDAPAIALRQTRSRSSTASARTSARSPRRAWFATTSRSVASTRRSASST